MYVCYFILYKMYVYDFWHVHCESIQYMGQAKNCPTGHGWKLKFSHCTKLWVGQFRTKMSVNYSLMIRTMKKQLWCIYSGGVWEDTFWYFLLIGNRYRQWFIIINMCVMMPLHLITMYLLKKLITAYCHMDVLWDLIPQPNKW